MNNFSKNLLLVLLPFYPFWAWISYFFTDKGISLLFNLIMLPLSIYFLMNSKKRLPAYLIFLILFALFHLYSVISNDLVPVGMNMAFFLLSDTKLLACTFLIVIENTDFDGKSIAKMSKFILITVVASLLVSVMQLKDPLIFFNGYLLTGEDNDLSFLDDGRHYSIYTWINLSTVGISFPILCSILINWYIENKRIIAFTIFSGIVVSFLSKSRYIMISIIIVVSQLVFANTKSFINKIAIVVLFVASVFISGFIASELGVNIDEIIANRIMEKENEMGSAKSRVTSYEVFLLKFPENPIIGVGPKTRQDVVDLLGGEALYIHVGYLCYLYYYGILGTGLLLLGIFFLVRRAWVVGKKYNFWAGFYGLLSFCLANFTLVYFELGEMGILLVIIYMKYYDSGIYLKELAEQEEYQ
jgi:O-Antigen ligase